MTSVNLKISYGSDKDISNNLNTRRLGADIYGTPTNVPLVSHEWILMSAATSILQIMSN